MWELFGSFFMFSYFCRSDCVALIANLRWSISKTWLKIGLFLVWLWLLDVQVCWFLEWIFHSKSPHCVHCSVWSMWYLFETCVCTLFVVWSSPNPTLTKCRCLIKKNYQITPARMHTLWPDIRTVWMADLCWVWLLVPSSNTVSWCTTVVAFNK